MVSMDFQTCHTPGIILGEAYERPTTVTEPTLWDQQRMRVKCPEFGVEVDAVAADALSDPPQRGTGGSGGGPPPPPSWGGPKLPGLFTKTSDVASVNGREVPRRVIIIDQPPGSFLKTPCAGHNCNPG